jgi:hypothetical protein
MDSVTGSRSGYASDLRASRDASEPAAFVADPRPVAPRRRELGRAILASAAIVAVAVGGALAARDVDEPARSAIVVAPGPAIEAPRSLAIRQGGDFEAPAGRLAVAAGSGRERGVVAMPGCEITLQLGSRQPRRILQCPVRPPHHLTGMLRVAPRQPLQFEVPGWRVQAPERLAMVAPDRAGLWTIEVPTCLSRGAAWLCATWYATLEVQS